MAKIKIFLDTDVIISSLLSKTKTGASLTILNNEYIEKVVSQSVIDELIYISKRHGIDNKIVKRTINKLTILKPHKTKAQVVKKYEKYVLDTKDTHVLAGTHRSEAIFLITHNIKHYLKEDIKNDFGILVKRPCELLQQLRLN